MNKLTTLRQLCTLIGFWPTVRFLIARLTGAVTFSARPPEAPAPLTVRFNNSDVVLLLGVFLHGDCHLKLNPPPALILDLGANIGLTATAFAVQFPKARIVAVEPDAATHQLCAHNTRVHAKTRCLRGIVGHQAGWGQVTNPEAISMAKQYAATEKDAAAAIPITTIDALLDEHFTAGPVLVKMDIEGAEIEIFRHPGPWLTRVQAVLVEPHGQGTAELIVGTLEQHGFTICSVGEKILGQRAPWL